MFAQYMALSVFPESVFVFSAFHSSCGQLTFGASPQAKADVTLVLEEDGRTRLVFINYHGRYYHNSGQHYDGCPKKRRDDETTDAGGYRSGRSRTIREDDLKRSLALALTRVDDGLSTVYLTVTSCDLFCRGGAFLRPSTWNWGRVDLDDTCDGYASLRDMMAKKHGADSVAGAGFKTVSAGELINKIMHAGRCHDGTTSMGGFVVLTRGKEAVKEDRERSFGFCFQRSKVAAEELGPWTLKSAEMLASSKLGLPPGDEKVLRLRDRILSDLLKEPITLSRSSFGRSAECLSLDFFR